MKINVIDKRVIRTKKRNIQQFFLFKIPLVQYVKIRRNNKKRKIYSIIKKHEPKKGQRIFYLKVHRIHTMSFACIQQWIETAHSMNAFIYFVCDNKEMEHQVYINNVFYNTNFAFIKSDRKTMEKQVNTMLDHVNNFKMWRRIMFSMLTPFLNALKHNNHLFYNIDADDILLYADSKKLAAAFLMAEEYMRSNNLDVCNLDMMLSKTFGVHWSFGVVICTNPQKCIDTINKNLNWRSNKELIEKYNITWIKEYNYNIDWLFSFFRYTKQLNMGTFYINKALVVHMPDIILRPTWAFMIYWNDGEAKFPILSGLYGSKNWGIRKIPEFVHKIDAGLDENSYIDFARDFFGFKYSYDFELDMLDAARADNMIDENTFKMYCSKEDLLRRGKYIEPKGNSGK